MLTLSLILDGRGGFRGDVVHHPCDGGYLGGDPGPDAHQVGEGDLQGIGGHAVAGVHRPHGDDPAVDPDVPLHPGPLPEEGREALPGPVTLDELLLGDGVRLPDDPDLLPCDLAEDPDGQARPREGHPVLDLRGKPEGPRHLPHLVLVQVPDGLDDPGEGDGEGHSPDVVVALDPALALDPVGVDGPLEEVPGIHRPGLLLEDPDELLSDPFPFLLGVGDSPQGGEEPVLCPHDVEGEIPEEPLYPLGLPLPHEAGVHVDGDEPVVDGPAREGGADRAVHPAREGHHDLLAAGLRPDLPDGLFNELPGVHPDRSRGGPPPCLSRHAVTNPTKGGEGWAGRELNSGWNWVARKNGWPGSSQTSILTPLCPEKTRPAFSSRGMNSGFTSYRCRCRSRISVFP